MGTLKYGGGTGCFNNNRLPHEVIRMLWNLKKKGTPWLKAKKKVQSRFGKAPSRNSYYAWGRKKESELPIDNLIPGTSELIHSVYDWGIEKKRSVDGGPPTTDETCATLIQASPASPSSGIEELSKRYYTQADDCQALEALMLAVKKGNTTALELYFSLRHGWNKANVHHVEEVTQTKRVSEIITSINASLGNRAGAA